MAAICVVVVLALSTTEAGKLFFGRWSFTRSVEADRSAFFRLKVDLSYKGDPVHFDIVVACNVRIIDYKDNSQTYEVGLVPTVYGQRMTDGKGLVVRPPNACGGQTTANKRVPSNFIPVVIVFDDADRLDFGTAYVSDEAYESPFSELKFGGATIESATAAEFADFRANGPPNLVARASYHSFGPSQLPSGERVFPPFARSCVAYLRFMIPENLRAHVRAFWPGDRPRFWQPSGTQEKLRASDPLLASGILQQRDTGGEWKSRNGFRDGEALADLGAALPDGGGVIDGDAYAASAPSYYAPGSDITVGKMPKSRESWTEFLRTREEIIEFREGDSRGFARCMVPAAMLVGDETREFLNSASSVVAKIDDALIVGASRRWQSPASNLGVFYERDEFYFIHYEFYVDSTRGDV